MKHIKEMINGKGSERGFTLLEVLIAMAILTIGLLGLGGLAATATQSGGHSQAITQATNIAQDRVEALLTVPFDNLYQTDATFSALKLDRNCALTDATVSRPVYTCTLISPSDEVRLDSKFFTWSYQVTHIDVDGNGTATINRDGLQRVEVMVNWDDPLTHRQQSINMIAMRGVD